MSSNHLLRFGVPSSDLAQVSEVDRLVAMSVTAKATAVPSSSEAGHQSDVFSALSL